MKTILHCDLNCFFASVEMLYHPEFRGVPMAIGGDRLNRHGIILAKNVPAKKKGIRTAETISEALRKCPQLIIRDPDYESYQYFSDRLKDLYYQYTDKIEPFGIDECWLDISESLSLFGGSENIARKLLYRAKYEIGLTLSIGISSNKIYAKLGSDLAAEDSYRKIDSLDDIAFLPVEKLLGVGSSTAEILRSYNIITISDLARKPLDYLQGILGKNGKELYCFANGIGHDQVAVLHAEQDDEVRSISCNMTSVRDLYDLNDFKIILRIAADDVISRLKKKKLYYRCIHLYLRYSDLKCRSLQISLKENSDLAQDIFDNALTLFQKNCDFSLPYRSIGVAVSGLSDRKDDYQLSFFEESAYSLKTRRMEEAVLKIRERFGPHAVSSLSLLQDCDLSHYPDKRGHNP